MRLYLYLICFLLTSLKVNAQTASFTAPDTVCVGAPVTITDQSSGAGTWFWNFCSGSPFRTPVLTNLGNFGANLNGPAHSVLVEDAGRFFVFVINNFDRNVIRLDFGNSLLNTPTSTLLTQFIGFMPDNAEGVQAVEDAAGKHLIVVGGNSMSVPKIVRLDFGSAWSNTPTGGVDWGNTGNVLAYPYDLSVIQEGGRYYGFATNQQNNTITRFEFGTDFTTTPAMINLGNVGGFMSVPYGTHMLKEGPNWYMFVANRNNHLIRYDFGTSITNPPTGTDLGTMGGLLDEPRDIAAFQDCGQTFLLVVNNGNNTLVRVDLAGGITGAATATSLGNPGNTLDFPASISSIFRTGNDLNAFIPDVGTGGITRLTLGSCNNSSIPNFTGQAPPPVTYDQPGTYTINLITDLGTPNQRSFCKNIVVLAPPVVDLGQNNIVICNGSPVSLDGGAGPHKRYNWTTGESTQLITVNTSGNYGVSVFNGGCTVTDNISISITTAITTSGTPVNIDCNTPGGSVEVITLGGTAPLTFSLNGGTAGTNNIFNNLPAGNYRVNILDVNGCSGLYNFTINTDMARMMATSATSTDPTCFGRNNGTILAQVSQGTPPFQFALGAQPFGNAPDFSGLGPGTYKVYIRNAFCLDSQQVTLTSPTPLLLPFESWQDTCNRQQGWVQLSPSGGTPPYAYSWNGNPITGTQVSFLGTGNYLAQAVDANGCVSQANIFVDNLSRSRINILTPDTIVSIGDEFMLRASNGTDYIWSPVDAGGVVCPICPETPARIFTPTQFIVRTLSGANCIMADTVSVLVDYSTMLEMPNAFTPNQDGVNDVFRPKAKAVVAFNMQIYNRLGNLIFTTSDHRKGWDGKYNGKIQPIATYVYVIKFGFWQPDGKLFMYDKKGTFDLIR
ncbi:T9SS type B sorting domain-containing protein [Chitinophaga deserti]|uniref:T9SS type B sorting domain-containing protein n=1 Tax=Chitinophaga deserti TaxID=2164099 RepID=UPI000D6B3C8E|nr:gliding motility-associated C-terminal domain-containing protein [Chitinophaga deserti]